MRLAIFGSPSLSVHCPWYGHTLICMAQPTVARAIAARAASVVTTRRVGIAGGVLLGAGALAFAGEAGAAFALIHVGVETTAERADINEAFAITGGVMTLGAAGLLYASESNASGPRVQERTVDR